MGKRNLFNSGFSGVKSEAKRQEKAREARAGQLFRLFLTDDGEERDVIFLTEQPVTFYEHSVKNGKRYENIICTGDDCPYCDDNDASYKAAWLVWDNTPYTNKEGKKVKGSIKLYVVGTKIAMQLDRLHTKYGLTKNEWTIVRSGKGTSTSYQFEKGDRVRLDEDDIEEKIKSLSEELRDLFDGTEESLMEIIQTSLMKSVESAKKSSSKKSKKDYDDYDDEDDYDDDYDEEYDDDEDDDNDYIEDDDEDEEDEPRRKSSSVKKKSSSSAKSIFKSKQKKRS